MGSQRNARKDVIDLFIIRKATFFFFFTSHSEQRKVEMLNSKEMDPDSLEKYAKREH